MPPTPVPPPVAPTLDPEVAYRAALESCEAQLTTGNFDEAAGRAAEAWFHEATEGGRTLMKSRKALQDQEAPFAMWFYMTPGHR